jgi:holo-[acyl-carrier protein] synthase
MRKYYLGQAAASATVKMSASFLRETGALLTCGTDVVEIRQFRRDLELGGERFLRRIYTENEIRVCRGSTQALAARFAGKEATAKALGTGIRGLGWKEIEILRLPTGEPRLMLHGRAASIAAALSLTTWAISLSHTPEVAFAYVVALGLESTAHEN